MTVKTRAVGDYRVLDLWGDFRGGERDYLAVRKMGHQALAERPLLALDCRRVTFVDSQTLGLFVELLRTAQARGGEVVLLGIGERVGKWFRLSGLDKLFRVLPDEAALAAGSGKPAPDAARRRAVLDAVNVNRMVEELQETLGEADENGEPTASGPVDEKMLTEIEKLLAGMAEEPG